MSQPQAVTSLLAVDGGGERRAAGIGKPDLDPGTGGVPAADGDHLSCMHPVSGGDERLQRLVDVHVAAIGELGAGHHQPPPGQPGAPMRAGQPHRAVPGSVCRAAEKLTLPCRCGPVAIRAPGWRSELRHAARCRAASVPASRLRLAGSGDLVGLGPGPAARTNRPGCAGTVRRAGHPATRSREPASPPRRGCRSCRMRPSPLPSTSKRFHSLRIEPERANAGQLCLTHVAPEVGLEAGDRCQCPDSRARQGRKAGGGVPQRPRGSHRSGRGSRGGVGHAIHPLDAAFSSPKLPAAPP